MSANRDIELVDSLEAEENLLLDFQLLLHRELTARNWSRADLAKASGISTARLSQIFSSDANPTLKTCARLFRALGHTVAFGVSSSDPERLPVVDGWCVEVQRGSNVVHLRPSAEKQVLVAAVKDSIAADQHDPQVQHWEGSAAHKVA